MSTTRISATDSGIEVDLGADEVVVLERRVRGAGTSTSIGRSAASSALTSSSTRGAEALGQRIELEVHAGRQRLHVAAGDRHAPLVPDHAAQHVQRGVGAHQGVAAVPVDLAVAPASPTGGHAARRACARPCRPPCGRRRPATPAERARCRAAGRRRSGRRRCGRGRRRRRATVHHRGRRTRAGRRRAGTAARSPCRSCHGSRRSYTPRGARAASPWTLMVGAACSLAACTDGDSAAPPRPPRTVAGPPPSQVPRGNVDGQLTIGVLLPRRATGRASCSARR